VVCRPARKAANAQAGSAYSSGPDIAMHNALHCNLQQATSALQAAFAADDVSTCIKESLDNVLQSKQYEENRVGQWTNECMEHCLKRLTAMNKPYKYVVTCLIMQKTGAGLHTAASCFWDNSTDGSRTVKWESKTMYCICSVFGLAL
jgi:dynein light chain Tctex-type 1